MAQNDPFTPDHSTVADGANTTFDGSSGETNAAIISGLYGNFNAEIYLEDSDDGGTSWTQITQFTDDEGDLTFADNWATQFNRLMVKQNERRIRIENVDSESGEVTVDGDER